jgi:predicted SprT family Zn-dependent metalloprotease
MGKERNIPIFKELADAYDYYNKELFKVAFEEELDDCIITLSNNEKNFRHFFPNRFVSVDGGLFKHEIALNMKMFAIRDLELTLSTLVHEMCHLYSFMRGEYKSRWHNMKWVRIMWKIGLGASSTGQPGGKETGVNVSHYIIKGELFEEKTKELIGKGVLIPFVEKMSMDVEKYNLNEVKIKNKGKKIYEDKNGNEFIGQAVVVGYDKEGKEKIKILKKEEKNKKGKWLYICKCGNKIYGKRLLDIKCNTCGENFKN